MPRNCGKLFQCLRRRLKPLCLLKGDHFFEKPTKSRIKFSKYIIRHPFIPSGSRFGQRPRNRHPGRENVIARKDVRRILLLTWGSKSRCSKEPALGELCEVTQARAQGQSEINQAE